MQVSVGIFGHVVVEDDVDSLDVHPAPEQVGRHQDALLEIFELLIARQPSERGEKGFAKNGNDFVHNDESNTGVEKKG